MAEEFEESEVIFSENSMTGDCEHWKLPAEARSNPRREPRSDWPKKKTINSVPVGIVPENVSRNSWFPYSQSDFFDGDDGNGEMVPPHVIVGRRIAGKMALPVCTGNGRTLKGRDLSEVRNSILRLTGFLET